MAGWWIIPAASRAAGSGLSQTSHLLMTGALGGLFLGTVEGMMEESTLKTLVGGLIGLLGGFLGATLGAWVLRSVTSSSSGMTAVVSTWAVAGLAIGMVSAWLERKPARILAGAAAGLLGGALGGWLGYQMYASLTDIAKPGLWGLKRAIEGSTGAILGAVLWFVLGMAEKVYIFKRRTLKSGEKKVCELCHETSAMNAWYCAQCGTVLQVAASPENLELPKRRSLARLISACQFLGRLSGTASVVIAVLAAGFLGSINFFLGLFGMLVAALGGYILYILFNGLAELLSPVL